MSECIPFARQDYHVNGTSGRERYYIVRLHMFCTMSARLDSYKGENNVVVRIEPFIKIMMEFYCRYDDQTQQSNCMWWFSVTHDIESGRCGKDSAPPVVIARPHDTQHHIPPAFCTLIPYSYFVSSFINGFATACDFLLCFIYNIKEMSCILYYYIPCCNW